jgi:hypothetical protein
MQNVNMSRTDSPSCGGNQSKQPQLRGGPSDASCLSQHPCLASAARLQTRPPAQQPHLSQQLRRRHHALLAAEEVARVQQRLPLKGGQQGAAGHRAQRLL